MKELRIVPECYVDTKVTEIIGRGRYNHQHGCGDVANQFKNRLKEKSALGIVDEDKNKGPIPKYFQEFHTISEENGLILKKHDSQLHYIILICPEIEKWLLDNAIIANVDPVSFNLPPKLHGLKTKTKSQNIHNNEGFYRFVKELIRRQTPGILTLEKWIKLFMSDELPL